MEGKGKGGNVEIWCVGMHVRKGHIGQTLFRRKQSTMGKIKNPMTMAYNLIYFIYNIYIIHIATKVKVKPSVQRINAI